MKDSQLPISLGYKFVFAIMMLMLFFQVGVSASFASDMVQRVQQSLADKGFDPGPVDGIWGSKTKNALMKFQESEGLSATGRIEGETKSRLFGAMEESASHAMAAPTASAAVSSGPMFPDAPDSEIVWGRHKP